MSGAIEARSTTRSAAPLLVVMLTAVVVSLGYLLVPEAYCFFNPSIDTHYTAGFSERKFAEVRAGMTREEVIALLGEPFGGSAERASSRWSYTRDGKCTWKDWAWLGREIVFVNDRVGEKISRVYYD